MRSEEKVENYLALRDSSMELLTQTPILVYQVDDQELEVRKTVQR